MKKTERYVAFLRGINVGGHHKIPMVDLRIELEALGLENIVTLLNSGNVIFDTSTKDPKDLEKIISSRLGITFGFAVPTIVRASKEIYKLFLEAPFQDVEINKDIRLYVSFVKKTTQPDIQLPWTSPDASYKILESQDDIILSVLDLSVSSTSKAMEAVEKLYGSNITTRNWKTIERIVGKL